MQRDVANAGRAVVCNGLNVIDAMDTCMRGVVLCMVYFVTTSDK